jgi:hypothetical protein
MKVLKRSRRLKQMLSRPMTHATEEALFAAVRERLRRTHAKRVKRGKRGKLTTNEEALWPASDHTSVRCCAVDERDRPKKQAFQSGITTSGQFRMAS